jgi:hypothetical protein
MLAWIRGGERGAADLLLWDLASRLRALGWPLAGAVQQNVELQTSPRCEMRLHVLAGPQVICISQQLGPLSQGCRLDTVGLERAVGLAEAALDAAPRLLIVNKFGRQEADGRGFRPLIGRALTIGVPVLTAVSEKHFERFGQFADGMAKALPPEMGALLDWCFEHCAPA